MCLIFSVRRMVQKVHSPKIYWLKVIIKNRGKILKFENPDQKVTGYAQKL